MYCINPCYNIYMGHRYKATKQLKNMIESGLVPEDIDIKTVFKTYYLKINAPKAKKYVWREKPRFYNRAMTMNTRAKKNGDDNKITAYELEEVWDCYNGKCVKCNSDRFICFDHIISYYKKGTNTKDNLQLLCRLCNMEKGVL